MSVTKVIWKSYHDEAIPRFYWDQAILEYLFMQSPTDWQHQTEFKDIAENEGAIVIINGRMHVEDTEAINTDLAKLRWVLLIITGDEEAVFPFEEIKHPLLRIWMQLPRMNRHNDVSFKLPNGPRPGTREILKEIGTMKRKQDWFFCGQINHERREQCVAELRYLMDSREVPNGTYVTTKKFGEERLTQIQYLTHMAQTKVVLCPSGIETPDTFRLYEALEAGCVPVVDAFATRNQSPGFWEYLFAEEVPFPIVDYWDKLPALMPELLRDYPANANRIAAWWEQKKRNMYLKLIYDIKDISR